MIEAQMTDLLEKLNKLAFSLVVEQEMIVEGVGVEEGIANRADMIQQVKAIVRELP